MKNNKIALFIAIVLLCTMLTSCSAETDQFFDTIFSIFPENSGVQEFVDNFEFPAFCIDAFGFLAEQFMNAVDSVIQTDYNDPAAIILMIVQIPLWLIILAVILAVVIIALAIDIIIAAIVPIVVILVCIAYLIILIVNFFINLN